MCLISQAYDYFYKRDYNNAITLFKKISYILGNECFKNIIKICSLRIQKILHIVYITDMTYLMPTYVSISSIIKQ